MNTKNGMLTETYTLPSKGKLYGEDFPEEITVRSMTTSEEKMRLGNQGFLQTMCNILDATASFPEGFDAKKLSVFDFHFLMYKMRAVSYGPTYKVSVTCPHCGKTTICRVNLDDLAVEYLPEAFEDPFDIGPLPVSGDILQCKYSRVVDMLNTERKAEEMLEKYPEYEGDPRYILNMVSKIHAINGKEVTNLEKQLYVERMLAMDSNYFQQMYTRSVGTVGMTTECHEECSSCGGSLVFDLPVNSEFFRPTLD